jgi:hypothetical protein
MIFMILLPGKPPYSQQGGGTPADNIKSKNFPYPFAPYNARGAQQASGTSAPQGTWQFIWGNLPYQIREAFYNTFREDKRADIDDWTDCLIDYRDQLEQGHQSDELFPLQFKIRDPVVISCAECSQAFTASQRFVEKLRADGKRVWCPECAQRNRLKRLAARSRRATQETTNQSTGYRRGATAGTQSQWRSSQGSWQSGGAGHGPSQTYQPTSSRPTSGNGGGIFATFWDLLFK